MAVPRYLPAVIALAALMTGCGTSGGGNANGSGERHSLIPLPWLHKPKAEHSVDPVLPAAGSGRGGYYQDDGPGANPPPNLRDVPDAEVKYEPYAKFANKPYSVLGQTYIPLITDEPFTQRGLATWYGVKFHGQRTSSGEPYDMYKMTAAHPTLPIPSYARVTSLDTGKSVVVRINDRGPFHSDRIIDVSYTAALKLGLLGKGSHTVQVERLFPGDPVRTASMRREARAQEQAAAAPSEVSTLMLGDRDGSESAAVAQAAAQVAPKAGYYLQLGSYSRPGKAEEMSDRLAKSGLDASTLQVVEAGAVKRLYSGPFATRASANAAARALPAALKLKPIVVKR